MPHRFNVELVEFATIPELDGAWRAEDFSALLDEMEFGDSSGLSEEELREMCLMSLQDLDPEDAALIVLKHVIGGDLRENQLRNMANEMSDEKLWEEYVDPAFHGRLFRAGSLLYAARPNAFPKPDAVKLTLSVTCEDVSGQGLLAPDPDRPLLVRLLAGGMDDRAILKRLYEEQLAGSHFANAGDIIWDASGAAEANGSVRLEVLSSGYWLDALERVDGYACEAHPDKVEEEQD